MEQQKTLVELRGVSKSFDGDVALSNVDISIRDKEFLTILGPSGCGKTTILRLIGGFETPDSGIVCIDGEVVNELTPDQRAVNTVFQSYALFPHMNVFNNVAFGLKMQKVPAEEIRSRVDEALKLVEMDRFAKRNPHELSGGQQQRVAIARALVNKPLVLLLDESFSALDRRLRKQMQMDIKHLQRETGITFVLVTHDQEEAFTMSDRVVVMNHGRVEQVGSPREVYEEPENMFVARFVGETNFFEAEVVSCLPKGDGFRIDADMGRIKCFLSGNREFTAGEMVRVLLRPEDLQLEFYSEHEVAEGRPVFKGHVVETVYKGTTYDVVVKLENGTTVLATEFFNEDAESVSYRSGDELAVSWIEGWEVVLPHEEQNKL